MKPSLLCLSGCLYFIASAGCNDIPPIYDDAKPANLHIIEEGKVYRSSQPTAEGLRVAIEHLGIKTVLNLRGPNPGKKWYDDEVRVCEELGVTLISHPMSAKRLPSGELLGDVLESLETAAYPLLLHCQAGADRTGAISAIYRMRFMGHDRAAALEELSPLFLHLRLYAPCMDTLAELYEPTEDWLTAYGAVVDQIECAIEPPSVWPTP